MSRVTNSACGYHVYWKTNFEGSNLRGVRTFRVYTVYSYTLPILVWLRTTGAWYENASNFSPTTKKHLAQAKKELLEQGVNIIPVSYEALKELLRNPDQVAQILSPAGMLFI